MSEQLLELCKKGNLSQVRELLTSQTNPIDIHYSDKFDDNALTYALMWACQCGHINIVKYLLTSNELKEHANINDKDNGGNNALMCACSGGYLDIVEYLLTSVDLAEHANIYEKNKNGYNALMYACFHDYVEVTQYLIIEQNMIIDNDTRNWLILNEQQNILEMIRVRDLYHQMNKDLPNSHTIKQRKI